MKFPETYRWNPPSNPTFHTDEGEPFGAFLIPGRAANGRVLKCIVDDGERTGWEHVSVSLPDSPAKCPSWDEMNAVKGLFWSAEECVVQFHPPESNYVNMHKGCLHLWRMRGGKFPAPPLICV